MSGIISDTAFEDLFTATKGNSTMQALVTSVYELGSWKHPSGANGHQS